MKKIVAVLLLLMLCIGAFAQQKAIDSVKKLITNSREDTSRAKLLIALGKLYLYSKPDTALLLAEQSLELLNTLQFEKGKANALNLEGSVYDVTGNYPKALSKHLESMKISEKINYQTGIEKSLHDISNIYSEEADERQSLNFAMRAKSIAEVIHEQRSLTIILVDMGDSYEKLNILDSALLYTRQSYSQSLKAHDLELISIGANNLGNIYSKMHQLDTALHYYRKAILIEQLQDNYDSFCETTLGMAKIFREKGLADSSVYYARKSISKGWKGGFTKRVLAASTFLTDYFEKQGRLDSAYHYQKVSITAKDSLYSQEKTNTFQNLSFAEHQRQQEIQEQEATNSARIRYYLLIAVIVFLVVLAVVFWRNNKQNKKARTQIQHTLDELKTTQAQLVQSAKMASLGELTAGIAHEIQNPLNFVNNFSDVNREMIGELKGELRDGNVQEALTIADDLEQNEIKINHHGRRADFIVKGMLEHSRTSTGERQVTNINVLADEFLKLSYHGLRAKDKNFNAELVTNFDSGLPKLEVVQQDIGRVLINLFGNAFYAVNQKAKTAGPDYKPTVEVDTARQNGSILITVKDNGTGIPESIREKIMQPFFTTKPTGDGTGLGLSLSYDIVVKGHGGTIAVVSKEGEGSEFTVSLPA